MMTNSFMLPTPCFQRRSLPIDKVRKAKMSILANAGRGAAMGLRHLSALQRLVYFVLLGLCFIIGPSIFNDARAEEVQTRAVLFLEHEQPSAWNDLLRSGFSRAVKDFGMRGRVVIAPPGSAQRDIFRENCANADIVIVATDNLHEALRDNAANYRRVKFGSVDAGIRAPNIMSVTFADEQAAFLAGAAAAMITRDNKMPGLNDKKTVAWLSGMETPAMLSLFNGFAEGATWDDPETRVVQAVVGSFTNPALARSKAAWLLDSGADIVVLAAGSGNPWALGEVQDRRACAIGMDVPLAGSLAITKAADRAVYEIMQSAASDKFRGKEIVIYNLANNGVDIAGIDEISKKFGAPANLKRRIGELRHELEIGSIHLKSLRARTLCDCLD